MNNYCKEDKTTTTCIQSFTAKIARVWRFVHMYYVQESMGLSAGHNRQQEPPQTFWWSCHVFIYLFTTTPQAAFQFQSDLVAVQIDSKINLNELAVAFQIPGFLIVKTTIVSTHVHGTIGRMCAFTYLLSKSQNRCSKQWLPPERKSESWHLIGQFSKALKSQFCTWITRFLKSILHL